ncbi:unnamed protein product [Echinostoma caproni]|uniref:MBF1 domain-containing protein n=1 Tax=Echinostoma caproni TaxID=27848 RepID=A0A183AY01_9TREM|nr:unnamed protein product [Echinostoma caproni]
MYIEVLTAKETRRQHTNLDARLAGATICPVTTELKNPATADKLGQRNALQSKHNENTEFGVQGAGHILARTKSPVT